MGFSESARLGSPVNAVEFSTTKNRGDVPPQAGDLFAASHEKIPLLGSPELGASGRQGGLCRFPLPFLLTFCLRLSTINISRCRLYCRLFLPLQVVYLCVSVLYL